MKLNKVVDHAELRRIMDTTIKVVHNILNHTALYWEDRLELRNIAINLVCTSSLISDRIEAVYTIADQMTVARVQSLAKEYS